MAVVLKDRVKETTSTAGTSDFVLGGSSSGYQSFSVIGANNFTYYCAYDNATGEWEVGYGQYTTTAGGTLVRTQVLSNSAATTSKILFAAGPKDVFITYPAEKAIYEEASGNVLIDGGPITVIGSGVTGYTTFSAALGELYADVDSFAQLYAQNLNDGGSASADFVAYNDLGDGVNNFVDVGINSSNYSSVDYPIFTPGSAYAFNDGGELFIGSATDDVVLFAGGVDTTDEAVRIDKTTKSVTTVADVNVGGALDVTGAAVFGSTVLLNEDPTLALQAVTKQYVDNATSNGFHVHTPVLVATTGNLTATYNQPGGAGAGVGATLTNSGAQAALSIDGVAMATNDRILVWQQTTGLQNGIYVVTTVGSGSTNWVLTRSADANTSSEGDPGTLGGGDYFFVDSGTTLGYHSYICVNTSAITFGTTSIDFNEFSSVPAYTGGTNITVDGQTINVSGTIAATNGGTGVNTVTTGDLLYGSASNTWSKLPAGSGYKSLVMNAGGTQVEWNAVALNQSGAVSGALPAINGGTGQASYAVGDMLYSDATNSIARLSGNTTTTKKFLGQTGTGSASTAPSWQQPAATDITGLAASATTDTTNASNISSGTLGTARLSGSYTGITGVGTLAAGTWNGSTIAAVYGGTGQSSYTVGDLLYASTATAVSKLADVAVGNALISGGVGSAPSYGKIGLATHVSGTLPVANGGTGATDASGIRTAAGATTVGGNVFTLANPSAITFPRFNADNTVSALDAASFRTAIGAGTGAGTVTSVTGTAPVVSTGGTTPAISMAAASSGVNGYMTGVYATKLDGIAAGAQPGTVTSVSGTGTVNGLTLTGTVTGSGSLTLGGSLNGGNSATVGGFTPSQTNGTANRVVVADSSGYINNNYFNSTDNAVASAVTYVMVKQGDNYLRSGTAAAVATFISGQSMNISGSATNATYAGSAGSASNATYAGNAGSAGYATNAGSATNAGFATNATNASNPTFSGDSIAKDNITTRTDSGFYESSSGTAGEGWPVNDGGWQHMIACTHSNDGNYYSMQIGGSFYDNVFYGRKTNGSGTTGWVQFITSGNIGSQAVASATNASYATNAGSATNATYASSAGSVGYASSAGYASNVAMSANRTDGTAYPVCWGVSGSTSQLYSCAAVTITSSTGTLTATTVTASSDETLKTNWRDPEIDFVERLAEVKHGTYERIDNGVTQDGVSGQSLQKVLPHSTLMGEDGKLSVAYGNAALLSSVQLAKRVVEQDKRIAKLEELVAKLTT